MKKNKGFTIIEVLVVVIIIGLLVAAATINYEKARSKGRDTKRKADIASIAIALDSYYTEKRTYPVVTSGLTQSGYSFSHSSLTAPWIGELTDYISILPVEKGPKVGMNYIGDKPCPNNTPADQIRNYNYILDDNTNPRGYALLSRLEIDNDSEATTNRTSCASGSDTTITFGSGVAGALTLGGYAIYAIYK